ncbi:bifunctional nuclease family protein [Microbacterium sp. dk485]|uniref:bifunctional nuclease family protein n=1 Tax=Microbacterium sp. dk485 TaxID=2560021 RepID=UPI001072FAAB|nr:bifunctional nuclease family protein [Microbacterium sp. dk485]TFV81010.1 bifunctional nuclease family protein [Microbacterium sp. dk485]
MVRVRVAGVALDSAQQHVILLKPLGPSALTGTILPVWIGAQEATAILVAVEGVVPPRPLAHDLMVRLVDALEGTVERVEVTRVDGGTFYAEVSLATPHGLRVIDARPSDAIALASRTDAPIWVADPVFAEAGVPEAVTDLPDQVDEEEEVDELRRFLDEVDPDDFGS